MGSVSDLQSVREGLVPAAFSTAELQVLDRALAKAWDLLLLQKSPLSLSQNELSTRTLWAKAITRIASGGERDVDRLAKFAVTAVKYQAG